MNPPRISRRLFATSVHAAVSLVVAGLAALVVFRVWYPFPYAEMSGGMAIFGLLVSVDVTLGPTLTLVIAGSSKPLREFRRDLAIIVVVQMAALAYGLYTLAEARPVALAFEIDRLRVVAAADVDSADLPQAPEGLRSLSWTGPRLIAAIKPEDPAEQMRTIELGLAGFDLSTQPRYWRTYDSRRGEAWRVSRSVSQLLSKYPAAAGAIEAIAREAGQPTESLRFLPMMSRQASWVSLLAAPDARPVGYLPLEGFF